MSQTAGFRLHHVRCLCAKTPPQRLKNTGQDAGSFRKRQKPPRGLPGHSCARRLRSACVAKQSSPTAAQQPRVCPHEPASPGEPRGRTGEHKHPSCPGEAANRNLANWACKLNVGACQLVLLHGLDLWVSRLGCPHQT